ncbi:MAG: zinc-binding dehydrogenase [Actinomycetota bacterium]
MKMMAQRLYGPKDLRWMEVDVPQIGENDVLIKVKFCGVCGTDQAIYSGDSSFWEAGLIHVPMTFGHEYSGVISAIGKNVSNFKIGDRVVADTGVSCGICDFCRQGNYLSCAKMRSVGTVNAHDGGYAEYTVMPERHVFMLPDNISFEQGAMVEPVATGLWSIEVGKINMGDNVVIVGTGPIGLGAVPFAVFSGAKKVILVGRKDFKLELGKKFGADDTINTTKEDLYARVKELTGGAGADVIVEASGSLDMLSESIRMSNNNCRIACVAFYEKPVEKLNLDSMILRNISLLPVAGSPNMMPIVIKMMSCGKVDFTPMITQVMPLKDAEKGINDLKDNSAARIKILLEI